MQLHFHYDKLLKELNLNKRQLTIFSIIDDSGTFPQYPIFRLKYVNTSVGDADLRVFCTVYSNLPIRYIAILMCQYHVTRISAYCQSSKHAINAPHFRGNMTFILHFCRGSVVIVRLCVSEVIWTNQILPQNYQPLNISSVRPGKNSYWTNIFDELYSDGENSALFMRTEVPH
jgi:hypothetical protein